MTQFARPTLDASVDDGITLATKLNGSWPALYTNHAGPAAPPSPEKGQGWIDTSLEAAATPVHVVKMYTGTVWRTLGTLNLSTGVYTTAGGLPLSGGTMTGPIQGQDGTAAAPGYAFSGNANLGMFRVGANSLGFSTAGVQRIALTGSSFDISTGVMSLSGASSTFNIDRASGAAGWAQINWRTGTTNRFVLQMSGAESTGNAGGSLNLLMFDDAGTQIVNFMSIQRNTRQMGINGTFIGSATMGIRSNDGASAAYDAIEVMNTSPAADAYVGINLRTASGALRGAIRGERPGSSNNGDLGVWTGVSGTLTKAATFRSNGNLDVVGTVGAPRGAFTEGVSFGSAAPFLRRIQFGWTPTSGLEQLNVAIEGTSIGYSVFAPNIRQISLGSGVMNIADNVGGFWSVNLNASDRRLKDDIAPTAVDALADILTIPTFQFNWKRDAFGAVPVTDDVKPPQPIGFVADTMPEDCVNKNGTYEGVNLLPLVARLVKAMQQQHVIIQGLEARIAELENKA